MERLLRFSGAAAMVCDQRRFTFARRVRSRLQMMGDFLVQRLTPASRKTFVGRLLNKGMVEIVTCLAVASCLEDQAGLAQVGQRHPKVAVACTRNCLQYLMGELTSDDGGDLCDVFGAPQPVKARHQRILQGEGHCAGT